MKTIYSERRKDLYEKQKHEWKALLCFNNSIRQIVKQRHKVEMINFMSMKYDLLIIKHETELYELKKSQELSLKLLKEQHIEEQTELKNSFNKKNAWIKTKQY